MTRVDWLPEALDDVERLYEFLSGKDTEAASCCVTIILEGAEQLRATPRIGRPMPDESGRRELCMAFGAGAYVLRYMIDSPGNVIIVRVWHSRGFRG